MASKKISSKKPIDPAALKGVKGPKGSKNLPAPKGTSLLKAPPVGYAVVGLGQFALDEVLPAFASCENAKLVALVSEDQAKLAQVGETYGIPKAMQFTYKAFEKMAEHPEIEAVYLLVPNHKHKQFTLRSAKMKKHVLCEKPMALNSKQAQTMIELCESANVKLMVGYRIRFEPFNQEVKSQLEKGTLGPLRFIQSHNAQTLDPSSVWRLKKAKSGGGALMDLGIYCVNTMRFVLNSEPTEVYATAYSPVGDDRFSQVERSLSWQVKFPEGLVVQSTCSYDVEPSQSYTILGEEGSLTLHQAYGYSGQNLQRTLKGVRATNETFKIQPVNQFAAQLDHFASCIRQDKDPMNSGQLALEDLLIIEAIYRSAKSRKPVKLK